MDQPAPNQASEVGFDEDRSSTVPLWLIVGSVDGTPIRPDYGTQTVTPRRGRPATRSSTLLHVASQLAHQRERQRYEAPPPSPTSRTTACSTSSTRTTALAKQSKMRADAFRLKLQPIPAYVKLHYTKHWS
jgi:hypothetical protein